MKISKICKTAAAIVLSAATMTMALPFTGAAAETDTAFDEQNVVLRLGVMSDIHVSYSNYNLGSIESTISRYADSVAALNAMSGNQLDAVMLCGDYTSHGGEVQGESFVSASKAIMDSINADKPEGEKTKFIMSYGNHDTEWNGQMSYSEWETMFNEYSLLDDVTAGPENSGCYKMTVEKNGKTYYFFSLETETYNNPSNTFRTDVLEWLDSELDAAVTANPNSYVYIVSHGPIKESGVYGADKNFEINADWGTAEAGYTSSVTRDGVTYSTSSDINGVLSKYPQVMYFSGHTHFTNFLESTIMSKDYTAVTVGSLYGADYFSSASNYLGGSNITEKPGYALYIEVDQNGNQRIKRVANPFDYASTTVTYAEEKEGVANPAYGGAGEPETLNGVVVGSVTVDSTSEVTTTLEPWVMSAPAADKSHLEKYSADARRSVPVFSEDAKVTVSNAYISGSSFIADIAFDAASCANNIIRYEISIADADGNEYGKRWAVGNWVPTADGVASGTSHLDATSFKYSGVTIDNSSDMVGYSIRVTAVDEFGASAYISSEPFTESPEHLLEDTKRVIYDNMFDVTPARAVASSNQSGVTFETDENGNLKTVVDATEGYRNAVFMTSKTKYDKLVTDTEYNAPFNGWAYPGVNPQNLTDFNADDTFVYEADFSTSGTTQFFLHVRTPDLNFGDEENNQDVVYAWKSDYTGVILNNNGVYIGMCNYNKFVSGSFKLDSEDTGTHHIKVISSPTLISIYIDGTAIGENIQFNPSAWSDTALAGKFKSDKMIPTMAVHVIKDGIVTLTNQELYHYDVAKETAAYTSVDYLTEANGFDGITDERVFPLSNASYVTEQFDSNGVLTVEAAMSEAGSSPWTNICYVTSAKNFAEKGASAFKDWGAPGYINAKYFTDLDIADSFVYEADFARLNNAGDIYFHVRTPDVTSATPAWLTDYTGVMVNGAGVYLAMLQTQVASSNEFKLTDNNFHHIKIVSTPNDVTVIIDGILIYDKAPFNKAAAVAAKEKSSGADAAATFSDYFASEDMIPTMAQFVMSCDMRITNQELRKVTEGVTPYTSASQNLINSEYGELISPFSNISGSFTESGNNFYSDTRYTNLETGRWTQDRLFLFGKENVKKTLDYKSSYVFSAIGTALNSSLTDPETGNTYPSRLTLYLGTYQDKEAFAFIQNTGFNFYIGSERKVAIDLAAEFGYSVGDSVRITALLTPFGFTFYLDGKILCTYEYADSNLINYQGLSLGIGGTLGCWRDIVIFENTENGALYAQKLAKKAEKVNRVKGLYITDEDYARADAVAAAANAFTGTDNSPLTIYVGIPESIISGAKAVNNMVYEGLTRVPDDADYNFTGMYEHYGIALFDSGKCPITLNDKWQVDLDLDIYSIGASDVRFMFGMYAQNNNVSTLKGGLMIQNSTGFIVENPTGSSISYTSLGGGGISIKKDDTHLHITYVVTPTENGVSLNVIGTSTDGNTNYFNFTAEYTDVTELNPYFFYRTANIGIKNLCVSYDLTDDFANLEKACKDKDTSDIAPLCVKNYSASLAAGKNILANTAQFGRTEIRNAAEEINAAIAAFEKFGDTNRDTKTNIADLVHLKKILCGLAEETVPSDMDADGDILSNDLVLLRQYFLK